MALFQRYNNENVLIRAVIAGLLDVLNNHIQYNQIWGNDPIEDIEKIKVPWYYNQSGDQRFMQDFYTHYAQCMPPRPVDGNFDMIPRGVITYTGSPIDAQRITSRYVQGRYVKEVDGRLEGYTSYLYSLPLNVSFDCELWADTELTGLKIEQEIREVFYRNVTYYVYYKGMRVGCTAGFPEQVGIEKKIQYSHDEENRVKITFSLEVETYQPVFDPTTEMKADNKISKFGYRLYEADEKSDGAIEVFSPKDNIVIPKGYPLWIEWTYTREGAIMRNVNLHWLLTGSNDLQKIELGAINHEYYIWNVPENFTSYKEPDILWEEDENISISRDPILAIVPNLTTGEITEDSFKAFSEGYFLTKDEEDASINIQLEMKDDNGQVFYTEDGKVWANIKYNKLDTSHPVTISPDTSIFFPGTVDYKKIDIHVSNANNDDVFGVAGNLTIV